MRESNSRWQVQSLPCYHYILAFLKTAYLHRPTVDNILFHFKFIKYERNSLANIKRFINYKMSNLSGRSRTQTRNSCAFTRFYQLNYPPETSRPKSRREGKVMQFQKVRSLLKPSCLATERKKLTTLIN